MNAFRPSARLSLSVLALSSAVAGVFLGGRAVTAQNDANLALNEASNVASNSPAGSEVRKAQAPVEKEDVHAKSEKGASKIRDFLHKGKTALGQNQYDVARTHFGKALELESDNLNALVNLAWLAQREKQWEESESYLRRALKQAVEDSAVWLALGLATLEQGKLEAATAALSQTVALDPKNARAHRFLGITLGKRGWLDGAEQEIRKSLEIDPDDAGAHFNLAVFYLQRKPPALELARRHYYKARDLGFDADLEIEAQLTKITNR